MPIMHLRIAGKVQGVGFRWFVRDRAMELGVTGWVRNLPNGDVDVVAQGEASQLATLEQLVGRGPSGAQVTAVRHLTPQVGADYPNPFRIAR